MGEFNYPKIDWEIQTPAAQQFKLPILRMYQRMFLKVISESPRGRGPSQLILIDLVLTNNPDIINKFDLDAALGKRDYSAVETSNKNPTEPRKISEWFTLQ